jgi:16S rRNA (cytosine967-C5)-methyltransferase
MQNEGEIYSIDISSKRLGNWKSEMERTGVTIAAPIRADARTMPFKLAADVVLVDPPCSNTGVFGKTPSMKWKVTPSRVRQFASQQYSILQAASQHVDTGGTLVYCTCSVLPEENEMILEEFLRSAPNFRMTAQTPMLGLPGLRGFDQCQRFYPHIHDCNGYFIAKLQRLD